MSEFQLIMNYSNSCCGIELSMSQVRAAHLGFSKDNGALGCPEPSQRHSVLEPPAAKLVDFRAAHNYLCKHFASSLPQCFTTSLGILAGVKLEHVATQSALLQDLPDITTCVTEHARDELPCADGDGDSLFDIHIGSTIMWVVVAMLKGVALAPLTDARVTWDFRFAACMYMQDLIRMWLHNKHDRQFGFGLPLKSFVMSCPQLQRLLLLSEELWVYDDPSITLFVYEVMLTMAESVVVFCGAAIADIGEDVPVDQCKAAANFSEDDVEVDLCALAVVLSLPVEQQVEYISATAHGSIAKIQALEHHNPTTKYRERAPMPALQHLIDLEFPSLEADPGSLTLKFLHVPKPVVVELIAELQQVAKSHDPLFALLLTAYVVNHCIAARSAERYTRQMLSAKITDAVSSADDLSLVEPKCGVYVPRLDLPSYMSIWQAPRACSSSSAGMQHAMHVSQHLRTLRREIWRSTHPHIREPY
eukprot:TRINITY_DN185_c0_g1_i25.p1 TRINITY_DN185_c0_g1~~TRINITY_DN185_c0_g1_i25.p1  ORF type:complete len:475 (+),score=69.56 TRINITY_DN185_c0_g1_i25:1236-2660(+)